MKLFFDPCKALLCVFLLAGNLLGITMRPQDIEELLRSRKRTVAEESAGDLTAEDGDGRVSTGRQLSVQRGRDSQRD